LIGWKLHQSENPLDCFFSIAIIPWIAIMKLTISKAEKLWHLLWTAQCTPRTEFKTRAKVVEKIATLNVQQ
jgi:hypothetical protein